jgi:tetratricopeptide (TPR) repeat protein
MYAPDYSLLQINLGIAHGALHRDAPANAHFLRAIDLDPQSADSYFYYARWLAESGHAGPAASLLKRALALNPNRQDARDLLLSLQRTASGRN